MLRGMKQKKLARFRPPTPDEQEILTHLIARAVRPEEVERFDQLLAEYHYLKNGRLVGQHLRYVAEYRGQWLALASWSAPALHIKARDGFIGWTEEQRRTRLPLLVNNSRLLVLPPCQCPNLISRFMKLMLARLSPDWEQSWGHLTGAGRNVCRSPPLSRHCLQGQRLAAPRPERRLETQRRGFLSET